MAAQKHKLRWFWPFYFAVIVALIILKRDSLLGSVGELLVKSDRDHWQAGDYIVVLMGDLTGSRAKTAFDLWRANQNQTILMMEEKKYGFVKMGLMMPPSAIHRAFFEKSGVPADKLLSLNHCAVDSTLDEATCFYRFLQQKAPQVSRVSLVTSFYHTSRASWIFEHVFKKLGKTSVELQMIDARALDVPPPTPESVTADETPRPDRLWWKREDLFLAVFNEYLKWTYWSIKGLPETMPVYKETGTLGTQNSEPDYG